MLEEYLLRTASDAIERAYARVVLALGSSVVASVILSGLSLILWPPLIYPSLALLAIGCYVAMQISRRVKRRINILFKNYIYEKNINKYINSIKMNIEFNTFSVVERLEADPEVVDGPIAEEHRRISGSIWLARGNAKTLTRRVKMVMAAGGAAVAIPHILMGEKAVAFIVFLLLYLLEKA